MRIKKKDIVIFISIFLLLLLVVGGTYAYWIWNSGENKNVVFNSIGEVEDYIVYDEGLSYFVGNFQPYDTFCQSASTTLSFYKTSEAYAADLTATIYMDVNSIGSNISTSNDVYWVVTSGDNSISCTDGFSSSSVISYGTFNGVSSGQTVTLVSNLQVSTVKQEFTVWIWIDSSSGNLSSLSGETVDTNIWTQIDMYSNNSEVPRLDSGMIPVTISDGGTVTTVKATSNDWYDYSSQQWANVVLVTKGSRNRYMNTSGVVVNPSDILAYYVWIPRYKYRIPDVKCSTLENPTIEKNPECYAPYTVTDADRTKLIEYFDAMDNCGESNLDMSTVIIDNGLQTGNIYNGQSIQTIADVYNMGWVHCGITPDGAGISITNSGFNGDNNLLEATTIDIAFEGSSLPLVLGDAKTSYRTHPAFWWDNDSDGVVDDGELLAGIWVGKFESTGDAITPTVLPNVKSLTLQNQATQFNTSLKFSAIGNLYGLSNEIVDSHMMKNSEWGAALYLSHSVYGINRNIRNNNNVEKTTGCGALTDLALDVSSCQIAYGSGVSSYPQSTTGNITGIFDMNGGASEVVMAMYMENIENSGFSVLPATKYYESYTSFDIYTACNGEICYGHALSETAYWYGGSANLVDANYSWLQRGMITPAKTPFDFSGFRYNTEIGSDNKSWRSVLVVGYDS